MLSPVDIQRLCLNKYPAYLRALARGEPFFPLPVRFGRPSSTGDWEELRREIGALHESTLGYHIDWVEVKTHKWGIQRLPERVCFETEDQYLKAVRKIDEVAVFRENLSRTRIACPALEPWVVNNPKAMVENASAWEALLRVCCYFMAHPLPNKYARELPIAVDTKFIDRHKAILWKLLDFLLPETARKVDDRFEPRFGLRYDEALIRLRLLDANVGRRYGLALDDVSVPLGTFRSFGLKALVVFITENKMTFLTFPQVENAIVLWGGGCAVQLLTTAQWLSKCRIVYWGDIDVHGFHILSRLRDTFPHVQSLMMDGTTLHDQAEYVVDSKPSHYEDVRHLSATEHEVYRAVCERGSLLEQEKIPQAYAHKTIGQVLALG